MGIVTWALVGTAAAGGSRTVPMSRPVNWAKGAGDHKGRPYDEIIAKPPGRGL